MEIVDALQRPLRDLRISVTDRCNFRCRYCMPKEIFGPNFAFLPHEDLLTFEEIARLVRIMAAQGVRKVRLTGGEPLLRRDLETLVKYIAGIDGIEDMAMTTNASLLTPERSKALKKAGLRRVSISLDSLDNTTFMKLNDVSFPVDKVLTAVRGAQVAGLEPVKVNMVVKKGWNDHDIVPMAEYFRGSGVVLRFIEYMDVGNSNGWKLDDVVPAATIVQKVSERWPLVPAAPSQPGEVATRYTYADGQGEIGVIASVTQPFCGSCNRLRLSAQGVLYTCLFASQGTDFRRWLRSDVSDEEITQRLQNLWSHRQDRYSELRSEQTSPNDKIEMSHIGG